MTPLLAPIFTSLLNLRLLETPLETNSGYATGSTLISSSSSSSRTARRHVLVAHWFSGDLLRVPRMLHLAFHPTRSVMAHSSSIAFTRRMPVQRAALSGMKYPTRESPARDAASPTPTTNLVAITVAPSTGRQ